MKLEHIPIDEHWTDFSLLTPMEESINTVETRFRDLMKNSNEFSKSRFGFRAKYYNIKFYPSKFYKNTKLSEVFNQNGSSVDRIREIFGILGPFVLVNSKNLIDTPESRDIISILSPAAASSGFSYPIIIQVSQKDFVTYQGFQKVSNQIIHFCSHTDWSETPLISNPQEAINILASTFPKASPNYYTQYKKFYSISDIYFSPSNKHITKVFCCQMNKDPIQTIDLVSVYGESKVNNDTELENEPVQSCLSVSYNPYKPNASSLSYFVSLLDESRQISCWKPSKYESVASKVVSTLFGQVYGLSSEKSCIKSAPKGSILIKLVEILAESENIIEFGAIWTEFLKEIRRRVNRAQIIPGVSTSEPDFNFCIIYQKLQMINFCVPNEKLTQTMYSPSKPTGMMLLSGKEMISPSTQIMAARTEDQIHDTEILLSKLYNDQNDKIKLQSTQLRSDISAFKAENPESVFEDFVRWYSPSDFNEKTKELSLRMATPDNYWRMLWDGETPKLAKDQYPIFDHVFQSELALDYLECLVPQELIGDLIPVVLSASVFLSKSLIESRIPFSLKQSDKLDNSLRIFRSHVEQASTNLSMQKYISVSIKIAEQIEKITYRIQCAKSLLLKFDGCFDLINNLLTKKYAYISNHLEMIAFKTFLENIDFSSISKATENKFEYILVSKSPIYQRLYVSCQKEKTIVGSSLQEIF